MSIEKLKLSLLEITGEDSLSFLQGQLTNDINLAEKSWQHSGYCSPKGRLLALFTLWRFGETTYALIDESLTESITKRLKMYVMRSKVTISHSNKSCFGVWGKDELTQLSSTLSNDLLNSLNDLNNEADQHFVSDGESHVLNYGGRFLYIPKNIDKEELEKEENQWLKENISSGVPSINILNSELFIPQTANLDLINGINFKKGCYTGQEIVARMHYLGNTKQRAYVCDLEQASDQAQAGNKVFADRECTKSIGNIINISGTLAFAALRTEATNENKALWLTGGIALTVRQDQPYPLNTNK